MSIAGTFINLEATGLDVNVTNQLSMMWNNNYTPFVNLETNARARQVANGSYDSYIRAWAQAYKAYADGAAGRMAFISIFAEMDGYWTPWFDTPAYYIQAYQRIRDIFNQEGVPSDSVRWVFSPNGWRRAGDPPMEDYYPGDALVDAVGFSGYNFGFKNGNSYWYTPAEAYKPYLDRLHAMAPTKPLFVSQTATTAYTSSGYSAAAKNQWLQAAYTYLASYPGILGVIYFNIDNPTTNSDIDWAFYIPSYPNYQYSGYTAGIADPAYSYIPPSELKQINLVYVP
jgi:beta-mannanase